MITMIFASDPNGIIGNKGNLPWSPLTGELKRFKETTLGGTVVMGRNTFLSLPKGPLSGRHNIVLTKKISLQDHWNAFKFNLKNLFKNTSLGFKTDVSEILDIERKNKSGEVFIIGGSSLYTQMEPYCNKMIWTQVTNCYEGDTVFKPSSVFWHKIDETEYSEYKILTFRKTR